MRRRDKNVLVWFIVVMVVLLSVVLFHIFDIVFLNRSLRAMELSIRTEADLVPFFRITVSRDRQSKSNSYTNSTTESRNPRPHPREDSLGWVLLHRHIVSRHQVVCSATSFSTRNRPIR